MFSLAIELSNIKKSECKHPAIRNMFARHNLYVSQAGAEAGSEHYWWTGEKNKGIAFIFLERPASDDIVYEMGLAAEKETGKKRMLCPGDEGYNEYLWDKVSNVQEKIRVFFDKFIQGDPATEEFQKLCDEYHMKIRFRDATDDPWIPSLEMTYDDTSTERLIISREIVATFYNGLGPLFQRIRRCPECGDYFYAKDIRKTYCSEKCRNTMNNRIRR